MLVGQQESITTSLTKKSIQCSCIYGLLYLSVITEKKKVVYILFCMYFIFLVLIQIPCIKLHTIDIWYLKAV